MTILEVKLPDLEELTRLEIKNLINLVPLGVDPNRIFPPVVLDFNARLHHWLKYLSGESSPKAALRDRIMLKACLDNKMVGFIAGHLTTRFDKDAEIESFYTQDGDESTSAWAQLLLHFIDWAKQHEAMSLCVGIGPEHNQYREFLIQYGARFVNPRWVYWDDMGALAERVRNPHKLRLV